LSAISYRECFCPSEHDWTMYLLKNTLNPQWWLISSWLSSWCLEMSIVWISHQAIHPTDTPPTAMCPKGHDSPLSRLSLAWFTFLLSLNPYPWVTCSRVCFTTVFQLSLYCDYIGTILLLHWSVRTS
jgi:hypothetical protein